MNYTITKDMQSFKKTIDLSQTVTDQNITFTGDIPGQIATVESGKSIVTKVFGTQDVSYTKVESQCGELMKKGKYKGKYKVTTTTYKAIVNNNGEVTGYEETGVSKVSYSKSRPKADTIESYQILNSKGKVLDTSATSHVGENTTILDTSKTLGVITFTNGDKSAVNSFSIGADNADNATANILTKYYAPTKKKNTYTGNWQNEEVDSTKANETFNLGAGDNKINFNMSQKIGKDKVILSTDTKSKLTLNFDGNVEYKRSGNNVLLSSTGSANVTGAEYTKYEATVKKVGNNYYIIQTPYTWSEEDSDYTVKGTTSGEQYPMSKAAYLEVKNSMGVNFTVDGNVTYYQLNDEPYTIITNSSTGYVTLNKYLKNGIDNVYVGNTSLKTLLEDSDVAKLGNKDSKKKQKLAGTFLKETFTGGAKNDTITTGSGDDTINLSAGTDSVTINGTGKKTVKYAPTDAMSGTTTINFAKNTDYSDTTLDVSNVVSQMGTNGAFVKSGNNLTIGKNVKSRVPSVNVPKVHNPGPDVTITNFFNSNDIQSSTIFAYEGETAKKFDTNATVYQFGTAKKANKIADTKYNDVLVGGSKADTFTISNGNATVYVNPDGDKINVTSAATGTLTVVQNWASNKSGSNTVNIDEDAALTAITITGSDPQYLEEDGTFAVSFEKTGDDLLYYHDVQVTTNTMGKSLMGTVHLASTTVQNFFNDKYGLQAKTQFLYGYNDSEQIGAFDTALGGNTFNNTLKINSVYNSKTKAYEYVGTSHDNSYVYGGKYKAEMTDSDGNDTYNITVNKNSNLMIIDTKGNDTIKFNSNVNNLRVFIGDNQDKIALYDKSTFTAANLKKSDDTVVGGVQITEYKRGEGNSYTFKNNKDETIDNFATWIDKVKSDVASWLNNNANYSTVSDVLNSKNTADINNLMKCYTTYEQFTNSLPKA